MASGGQESEDSRVLTIRAGTWNLHWLHDDYPRREQLIVAELDTADLDVVCLQEAWAEDDVVQVGRLADRLGYEHYSYLPVRSNGSRTQGLGVLARHPIRRSWPMAIADESMHRRALIVVLDTPVGSCAVMSVGLWGSAKIEWSLPVIGDRLGPYRAITEELRRVKCDLPPLVGADFNAQPDSAEVRWLRGADPAEKDRLLYFVDLWTRTRPGEPGYTVDAVANPLRGHRPAGRWRSDYLLAGCSVPELHAYRWDSSSSGLLGNGHGHDLAASDHYGIWAQLTARPHPIRPDGWHPSTSGTIDTASRAARTRG